MFSLGIDLCFVFDLWDFGRQLGEVGRVLLWKAYLLLHFPPSGCFHDLWDCCVHLGTTEESKKKLRRDQAEAMRPWSHWINHLWCHTTLGLLLLLSQSILCCVSLHEIDFLLSVAKSILNYTPQCEDDKGGVNLLIAHSITAPSISQSPRVSKLWKFLEFQDLYLLYNTILSTSQKHHLILCRRNGLFGG